MRLPGGDAAVRAPWRMACAWLGGDPLPGVDAERWDQVARLAGGDLSPMTTSAGRLFDAAAALCGVCLETTYEGQAAIELEALCDPREEGAYEMPGLDPRPALEALVGELKRGVGVATAGARFHNAVADATACACIRAAAAHGTHTAVLSGGVFQNRLLLERTARRLTDARLRVLVPEKLPPNDGGIAFGQAAVAAATG